MGMKVKERPIVKINRQTSWFDVGNKVYIALKKHGYIRQAQEFANKAARLWNSEDVFKLAKKYVQIVFL